MHGIPLQRSKYKGFTKYKQSNNNILQLWFKVGLLAKREIKT